MFRPASLKAAVNTYQQRPNCTAGLAFQKEKAKTIGKLRTGENDIIKTKCVSARRTEKMHHNLSSVNKMQVPQNPQTFKLLFIPT